MNPFYVAATFIAVVLAIALFQDDADDDNDGPGGGILQPQTLRTFSLEG